jgi:flagellar motor switch protein FliG
LRPEVRVGAEDDVTEKAMGTPRLKIAEGTWPQDEVRLSSAKQEGDFSFDAHSPLASTDSIHEYLVSLSTEELRTALGKADTRQALLTLCGLPNAKAESLLASLPRRQAKQVRDQLAALGTLHLREIDEAKTVVASLAYESAKATGAPSRAQGARGASADATSRPKTAAMSAAA